MGDSAKTRFGLYCNSALIWVTDLSSGPERTVPVVSSSGRRADAPAGGAGDEDQELTPLLKNADPEFEKLLEEEEQIERATRTQSQTPNFRPGDD